MNSTNRLMTRTTRSRSDGLSLIELLIAMTIGSIILIGLVGFASTASRDQGELTKVARQLDNARYALQILKEDLQHAGYYGQYHADPAAPGALPDPCSLNTATMSTGIGIPVQPYNATNAGVPCVRTQNYFAGTDIVVIRRASSEETPHQVNPPPCPPAATDLPDFSVQNRNRDLFIQSNISTFRIATGNSANYTDTAVCTSNAPPQSGPIRKFETHIYFVDCSLNGTVNCTGLTNATLPATAIPTLKRLVLRRDCASGESWANAANGALTACPATGPLWVVEPIAEGIQNLQLDYGLDTDDDGIPNGAYVVAPALADMDDIVAVRLFVLGRNRETSLGHTDTKIYNMGVSGNVGAFSDGYKRNNYNSTVQIVNTSIRKSAT